jgi:hypothetical protein
MLTRHNALVNERIVMADLHNISDHMARACECGCVRFNLLRSGSIECDDCGIKKPNLIWSEDMNPNYQPESKVEFTAVQINAAQETIRLAIRNNQQCFWHEIVKQNNGKLPEEALLEASRQMQKNKQIRLKEDSLEHAMEYILL